MHRQLFAAALIAALPVLAFGAGQSPAATEKPHPSASAHANAVAGQTNAARIEACTIAANTLIDNLDKGDAKAATADFDATMQANLSADKLAGVWRQVGLQMGNLQSRGAPQNAIYQDDTFVTIPLHFKNRNLVAQVVCDANDKVAGFFLRPSTSVP
jgi:hypothetical protein